MDKTLLGRWVKAFEYWDALVQDSAHPLTLLRCPCLASQRPIRGLPHFLVHGGEGTLESVSRVSFWSLVFFQREGHGLGLVAGFIRH